MLEIEERVVYGQKYVGPTISAMLGHIYFRTTNDLVTFLCAYQMSIMSDPNLALVNCSIFGEGTTFMN